MKSIFTAICIFVVTASSANIEKSILSEKQWKNLIEWYNSPSRERDIESFKDWQTNTKAAEYFLIVGLKNTGYSVDVSIQQLESGSEEHYITVNAGKVEDENRLIGSVLGVATIVAKFAQWKTKYLIVIVNDRIWGMEREALLQMYDMLFSNADTDSSFLSKNLQLISDVNRSPSEEYTSRSNFYHNKNYGFSVVFPDGWLVGPGNTPHTVIRADSRPSGEEREHISIQVDKKPPEAKYLDIEDMAENVTDMINPQSQVLLGSGYTKIGGQKAFYFKIMNSTPGKYAIMKQTMTFRTGYMYVVGGSVFGTTPQDVRGRFISFEPTLNEVLASFQFEGNAKSEYDSLDVSDRQETPGIENTLLGGILISMIITWTIGLAPPVLLRYVALRKPIKKRSALIIVILLGITNLAIFVLLGSQSKTHAVLIIIAMVSYWILNHGYSNKA